MTDRLPPDRTDKLRRLRQVTDDLKRLKGEYEELRDELVPLINEDGFIYLLDDKGVKYRASVTEGETMVFNLGLLRDELPVEVFEEVTERKVNRERFDQAASAGRVPAHLLTKAITGKPKAAFVHFEQADRDAPARKR